MCETTSTGLLPILKWLPLLTENVVIFTEMIVDITEMVVFLEKCGP